MAFGDLTRKKILTTSEESTNHAFNICLSKYMLYQGTSFLYSENNLLSLFNILKDNLQFIKMLKSLFEQKCIQSRQNQTKNGYQSFVARSWGKAFIDEGAKPQLNRLPYLEGLGHCDQVFPTWIFSDSVHWCAYVDRQGIRDLVSQQSMLTK